MNTIPTTFRHSGTSYTVVGGRKTDRIRKHIFPLSFVILNRKGRFYREKLIRQLSGAEVGEILYVTDSEYSHSMTTLEQEYPQIRILHIKKRVTPGEKINIGIDESRGEWIFILWDDMQFSSLNSLFRSFTGIREKGNLCSVPVIRNSAGSTIPTVMVPGFMNGELKVMHWLPRESGMLTIFPFDYCGIYNKDKFLLTGGYDYTFANPYWQKLDFGFRVYMWGEKIDLEPSILLLYAEEIPEEDSTPDESYKYFFLKNMAVRFRGDCGVLPLSQFFQFMIRSDSGPVNALREFLLVRRWVRINRFRFKQDALRVIDLWEVDE